LERGGCIRFSCERKDMGYSVIFPRTYTIILKHSGNFPSTIAVRTYVEVYIASTSVRPLD